MNRFLFLLFLLGILISEPGCLRIISPPASILAVEANVSAIAVTGKSTIADYACMKYQAAITWAPGQSFTDAANSTLMLSTSSVTGKFFASKADCISGTNTTQISVAPGSATANFYFLDTTAETATLTATMQQKFTSNVTVQVNQLRVLGQLNGTTNSSGVTAIKMNTPKNIAIDDDHIAVTDGGNERVLLWTAWPTTDGQVADLV